MRLYRRQSGSRCCCVSSLVAFLVHDGARPSRDPGSMTRVLAQISASAIRFFPGIGGGAAGPRASVAAKGRPDLSRRFRDLKSGVAGEAGESPAQVAILCYKSLFFQRFYINFAWTGGWVCAIFLAWAWLRTGVLHAPPLSRQGERDTRNSVRKTDPRARQPMHGLRKKPRAIVPRGMGGRTPKNN